MIIKRKTKDTLTPAEMDIGDILEFTLRNGNCIKIGLLGTGASEGSEIKHANSEYKTISYNFFCRLEINGKEYKLEREVSTQKSFYEPWVISGVSIWFDAVSDIFKSDGGFMHEKDAKVGLICTPNKKARFVLQDSSLEICPEEMHPICPLPKDGLKIENCYRGEDCWMGAYDKYYAHCGLDINHKKGTPIYAPLDMNDHHEFASLKKGDKNNRWRGVHKWDNGSEWVIQVHHHNKMLVDEHTLIKKGVNFASGAGIWSGVVDHSHFVFRVMDEGIEYMLDPWILFWKMYRDNG